MRLLGSYLFLSRLIFGTSAITVAGRSDPPNDASVLILGGGVTGVIAARTLHERGHDNFIIVDARDELGGRMQNKTFGESGRSFTVEQGPNWVQGTQTGNGPANPIFSLTKKHGVKTQLNNFTDSMCKYDTMASVTLILVYES